MNNATQWKPGDKARDPRDGETVEVLGEPAGRFYPVLVRVAGRGGPSGPSALAGEVTERDLCDPSYPFERVEGQVAA
jgi:hypothetical protein